MTRKEMKRLRRDELLEMLIEQTKRGDALEEEMAIVKPVTERLSVEVAKLKAAK